jgi:hypothetical protein
MTDNLPEVPNFMTGGCMCGAVRYRISEKPIVAALCHCNRCRPQSGSAFSTVIIIKRSAFELEGETTVFEDVGASDLRVGRRSCARCGSPLATEADVTPDLMFVKTGGIDHNEWFRPVMELFVTPAKAPGRARARRSAARRDPPIWQANVARNAERPVRSIGYRAG